MYPVCRFEIALSVALFSRWLVKILKSHFPVLILCIFLYTLHYACDYKCSIRLSIFSELLDKCFMRSSAWKHHRAIQRKSLEHFKVNIVFEDRHKCFNCAKISVQLYMPQQLFVLFYSAQNGESTDMNCLICCKIWGNDKVCNKGISPILS